METTGAVDPLVGFPVVVEIPVAWGEMDAFGHVNNAVYFRYFESARMAYFERLRVYEAMEATGLGPILASANARFRLPLHFPDTVRVGVRILDMGADRFTMGYSVWSQRHIREAASGESLVVWYDYRAACKAIIPEALRERVGELESTALHHVTT